MDTFRTFYATLDVIAHPACHAHLVASEQTVVNARFWPGRARSFYCDHSASGNLSDQVRAVVRCFVLQRSKCLRFALEPAPKGILTKQNYYDGRPCDQKSNGRMSHIKGWQDNSRADQQTHEHPPWVPHRTLQQIVVALAPFKNS